MKDLTPGGSDVAAVYADSEWLSDVLKHGGIGLWRWDSKADRVIWTENIRQLMGAPSEEISPDREGFLQMIRAEDRDAFEKAIIFALESESEFRFDFQANSTTSGPIWLEAVGHVLKDADGLPFAIDGAIYDITQRMTAEKNLIETHDSYQRIISAAGLVVYHHDILHDEYQIANLVVLENLLGHPYEGSASKLWKSVKSLGSHPIGELAGHTMDEAKELFRLGKLHVWRAEYKVMRSDGQIRWLYDNSYPLRNSSGEVVGSFGILQDITELKRLSEAIQSIVSRTSGTGDDYLRKLVVALSESLEVRCAFIGEVDEVQPGTARTLAVALDGKPEENFTYELIGTPCERVTDASVCFFRENVQTLFPEDKLLKKMKANAYLGAPLRSVDGQAIGLIAVLNDKKIDETLNPVNVLQLFASHAAAEVERQRSETKLKESESLYRSLVSVQSEGIVIWDENQRVLACNQSAQRILRTSEAELLGSTPGDSKFKLINRDGTPSPPSDSVILKVIRTGKPEMDRLNGIQFEDGTTTWISVNAMPIEKPGDSSKRNIVVSFADVTAQVNAEEDLRKLNADLEALVDERTYDLRRANRELETFAYSVSHDLRQPLRAIDGFTRLLEMDFGDRIDATGKGYIDTVRAATRRMSDLIDDLLRLSRLASHEVVPQSIDIGQLSRDCLAELNPDASGRDYELIIADGLVVRGDENLLRAALDNLIQNAWKFTAHEKKAVIEVGKKGDAFFVSDNGVGFDMKYSNKLFEPFQRLHTRDEFEGTGIGLATVRRIIERHKGQVWAESELGKGTIVYFTVPC